MKLPPKEAWILALYFGAVTLFSLALVVAARLASKTEAAHRVADVFFNQRSLW